MAVADRGSFLWFLMGATNLWLSIMLMDQVSGAVETIFGTTAAACLILGLVVFKQEQREILLNPLKVKNKEVHEEEMSKQGKGIWLGVIVWFLLMMTGTFIF